MGASVTRRIVRRAAGAIIGGSERFRVERRGGRRVAGGRSARVIVDARSRRSLSLDREAFSVGDRSHPTGTRCGSEAGSTGSPGSAGPVGATGSAGRPDSTGTGTV